MKKAPIAVIVCLAVLSDSNYVCSPQGQKVAFPQIPGKRKGYYFDGDKPAELPHGFQSAFAGKVKPGLWTKAGSFPFFDGLVAQEKK